jgi:glycine cleavage system H protein
MKGEIMSNIPQDCRYTKEHEWAKQDGDELIIGITDHAQAQLGDIVFLELPEIGSALDAEQAFGVIESVKAVSDLFAPLAGEITGINDALVDAPEVINADAFSHWLVRIKPANAADWDSLMSADDYAKYLEDEAK